MYLILCCCCVFFLRVTQFNVVSRKRVVLTRSCFWMPVFYPGDEACVCERGSRLTCVAWLAAVSWCRRPLNDDSNTRSVGIGNKRVAGVKWDVFSDITERLFWFSPSADSVKWNRHLNEPFKFLIRWRKAMEEESSAAGLSRIFKT